MSQPMHMPPVHEPFIEAVSYTDTGITLSKEQQDKILREADQLPFQWLRTAWQKAKGQSMTWLVHLAQEGVLLLLEQVNNRLQKNKSVFHEQLRARFTDFIIYLRRNYSEYFNDKSRMPQNMWQSIQEQTDTLLVTEDDHPLQAADKELAELVRQNYLATTRPDAPSFARAGYWLTIAERLMALPAGDDPSMRIIYLLISYNFNNGPFVSYLLHRFASEIYEEDAARHWTIHMQQINRIADVPGICFDDQSPGCKEVLMERITDEIKALDFIVQMAMNDQQSGAALEKIDTGMTSARLGLFCRLLLDAGLVTDKDKFSLARKFSMFFTTARGGATADRVYNTMYTVDEKEIGPMKDDIIKMLNCINAIQSGPGNRNTAV
jgi:hypothetical protein